MQAYDHITSAANALKIPGEFEDPKLADGGFATPNVLQASSNIEDFNRYIFEKQMLLNHASIFEEAIFESFNIALENVQNKRLEWIEHPPEKPAAELIFQGILEAVLSEVASKLISKLLFNKKNLSKVAKVLDVLSVSESVGEATKDNNSYKEFLKKRLGLLVDSARNALSKAGSPDSKDIKGKEPSIALVAFKTVSSKVKKNTTNILTKNVHKVVKREEKKSFADFIHELFVLQSATYLAYKSKIEETKLVLHTLEKSSFLSERKREDLLKEVGGLLAEEFGNYSGFGAFPLSGIHAFILQTAKEFESYIWPFYFDLGSLSPFKRYGKGIATKEKASDYTIHPADQSVQILLYLATLYDTDHLIRPSFITESAKRAFAFEAHDIVISLRAKKALLQRMLEKKKHVQEKLGSNSPFTSIRPAFLKESIRTLSVPDASPSHLDHLEAAVDESQYTLDEDSMLLDLGTHHNP